jgi:hypothetical protein
MRAHFTEIGTMYNIAGPVNAWFGHPRYKVFAVVINEQALQGALR